MYGRCGGMWLEHVTKPVVRKQVAMKKRHVACGAAFLLQAEACGMDSWVFLNFVFNDLQQVWNPLHTAWTNKSVAKFMPYIESALMFGTGLSRLTSQSTSIPVPRLHVEMVQVGLTRDPHVSGSLSLCRHVYILRFGKRKRYWSCSNWNDICVTR